MSEWVPRKVSVDPISFLIDSQTLGEESSTPSAPIPVPASTSSKRIANSNVSTVPSSGITSSSSNLIKPTPPTKTSASSQTVASNTFNTSSERQPITAPSSTSASTTDKDKDKTPQPTDTQVLTNICNGLSTVSNSASETEMQAEDNSTKIFAQLQPRSVPLTQTPSKPISEVKSTSPGVAAATREINRMEISDNAKTINKLWKLPDCGKISNPYFKRDVDNSSTSSGTKTPQSQLNAKENHSRSKTNRSKSDSNREVIPFIEIDDTDSVHELSTTDESDDESIDDKSNFNSRQKKHRARREPKREKEKLVKEPQPIASSSSEKQDKTETIPGLGSPPPPQPLETTIEQVDETVNQQQQQQQQPQPETSVQPAVDSNNVDKPSEKDETSTREDKSTISSDNLREKTSESNGIKTESKKIETKPKSRLKCIRLGCCNFAIANADWDSEYCSSSCAVEHCKSAFLNWVALRQSETVSSTTTSKTPAVTTTIN